MHAFIQKIRADYSEIRNLPASVSADAGILTRVHHRILGLLKIFAKEHNEPARLGWAVFLGVIVGMTPFFGLHLLICLMLATVFRLNKFWVYAAANISIPPMIPLIAVASVQTAGYLMHGKFFALDLRTVEELRYSFFGYWVAGAVVDGAVLGGIAGLGCWAVAKWKRQGPEAETSTTELGETLFAAFRPEGSFEAHFVRAKARHDVVYREVLARSQAVETMIDVGGGMGILPMILGLAKKGRLKSATVLDWDQSKLDVGARVAARLGLALRFEQVDVFKREHFEEADCIACIDLLHYKDLGAQRALVARMAAALRPGGILIIRDMDRDLKLRTACTVLQEKLCLWFKLTRADGIVPRSGADLRAQLEGAGLSVSSTPCYGRTPFSNSLWVAERFLPREAPVAGS